MKHCLWRLPVFGHASKTMSPTTRGRRRTEWLGRTCPEGSGRSLCCAPVLGGDPSPVGQARHEKSLSTMRPTMPEYSTGNPELDKMTEEELAEYFYEHREDESLWGTRS